VSLRSISIQTLYEIGMRHLLNRSGFHVWNGLEIALDFVGDDFERRAVIGPVLR